MPAARDPLVRFEEKIFREPNSGCWLWTARCDPKGYGWFKDRHSSERLAHRFSWIFHHGGIPVEMHVLHKCDTPSCVRPDHLFLGSNADNCADKVSKGRQARGVRSAQTKFTEQDVLNIRASTLGRRTLALIYGVNEKSIRDIRKRIYWRHL